MTITKSPGRPPGPKRDHEAIPIENHVRKETASLRNFVKELIRTDRLSRFSFYRNDKLYKIHRRYDEIFIFEFYNKDWKEVAKMKEIKYESMYRNGNRHYKKDGGK